MVELGYTLKSFQKEHSGFQNFMNIFDKTAQNGAVAIIDNSRQSRRWTNFL
jgi:hypothetical protein